MTEIYTKIRTKKISGKWSEWKDINMTEEEINLKYRGKFDSFEYMNF